MIKTIGIILIILSLIPAIVAGYFSFTENISDYDNRYSGLIAFHNQEEYNELHWKITLDKEIKILDELKVENEGTPIIASLDIRTKQEVDYLPHYKITGGHYIGLGVVSFLNFFGAFFILAFIIAVIWDKLGWFDI